MTAFNKNVASYFDVNELTIGATTSWDYLSNPVAKLTLTQNTRLLDIQNLFPGASATLYIQQDSTGGYTVDFGTVLLTSLDVEDITFQSGTTIRYTFNGSPDLSSISEGDRLVVSSATNSVNSGNFVITDVNDSLDFVEVTNTLRTDSGGDETSSPATANIDSGAYEFLNGELPEMPSDANATLTLSISSVDGTKAQSQGQSFSQPTTPTSELSALDINNSSTSLIDGGDLSINGGDNSKIDIAAGTARVVDNTTDPANPTLVEVPFGPVTALTLTNIGTTAFTNLGVNSSGAIIQLSSPPSPAQLRTLAFIGQARHEDMATVDQVVNLTASPAINPQAAIVELNQSLGRINVSGNVVSPGTQDARIEVSAGVVHFTGFNYQTDKTNPNFYTTANIVDPTFTYVWRDGSGGFNSTTTDDINADAYDDDTGGAGVPNGSVANNDFSAHYVFILPGDRVVVQYGQDVYDTLAVALREIEGATMEFAPILQNAQLRAVIIIRGSETAFSDPTRYRFLPTGKLNEIGLGSASAAAVTLQTAYNNSDPDAEITTDSTRGPVDIKQGIGAPAILQQWRDTTGFIKAFADSAGNITHNNQYYEVQYTIDAASLASSGEIAGIPFIPGQESRVNDMWIDFGLSTVFDNGGDRRIVLVMDGGTNTALINLLDTGLTSFPSTTGGRLGADTNYRAENPLKTNADGPGDGYPLIWRYSGGTTDYTTGELVLVVQYYRTELALS